jgi:hypothetical protein
MAKKPLMLNNFYTLDNDGNAIEAYEMVKSDHAILKAELNDCPQNTESRIHKIESPKVDQELATSKKLKTGSKYCFIDSVNIRTIGVVFENEDKKERFDADIFSKGEKITGTAIINAFEKYFAAKDDVSASRARTILNNSLNAKNHHMLFIESAILADPESKKKNKLFKIPKTHFDSMVLFYQQNKSK